MIHNDVEGAEHAKMQTRCRIASCHDDSRTRARIVQQLLLVRRRRMRENVECDASMMGSSIGVTYLGPPVLGSTGFKGQSAAPIVRPSSTRRL
jgi:hypothetical protein